MKSADVKKLGVGQDWCLNQTLSSMAVKHGSLEN